MSSVITTDAQGRRVLKENIGSGIEYITPLDELQKKKTTPTIDVKAELEKRIKEAQKQIEEFKKLQAQKPVAPTLPTPKLSTPKLSTKKKFGKPRQTLKVFGVYTFDGRFIQYASGFTQNQAIEKVRMFNKLPKTTILRAAPANIPLPPLQQPMTPSPSMRAAQGIFRRITG